MHARRLVLGLFAALSASVVGQGADAQQPAAKGLVTTAAFTQGEAKALPEDFFAELEQSRLHLKLEDFGLGGGGGGLDDTLVTLITPSGETRQAQSDAAGNVTLDGVQPGPVGLVVTGADRHASVAVYAQEKPAGDAPTRAFTLPVMRVQGAEVLKQTSGYSATTPPAPMAAGSYEGFARSSTLPVNYFQVRLQGDGGMPGRVFTVVDPDVAYDYTGTNVTIYQGGQEIARTVTDAGGEFLIPGMAPGYYGVIAAGPAGYGAFGFEVVPADGLLPQQAAAEPIRQVSMQIGGAVPADRLYVMLMPPAMLPALRDVLFSAYGAPEIVGPGVPGVAPPAPFLPGMGPMGGFPAGGGFAGGYSGGGGGGGFGGGGMGGLAGLAALGGIAAVIAAEDDDEGFVVPGPASPAVIVQP